MTDRAPPGPSAFEKNFEEGERVEYLDPAVNRWKNATIHEIYHNVLGVMNCVTIRLQTFEPFNTYHDVFFPFRSIRIPAEHDNNHDDLLVGSLQMPKFALPTFKTPSLFKRTAPPPIALVDGVPANLTYAFSRKLDNTVKMWQYRGNYHYYGLLTRDGNKFYFQMQTLRKGVLTIKVCPQNTTFHVRFWSEEPSNIGKWISESLNLAEQTKLNVFFIKSPNDYFGTLLTWNQNIWPMDKAPVEPVSVTVPLKRAQSVFYLIKP